MSLMDFLFGFPATSTLASSAAVTLAPLNSPEIEAVPKLYHHIHHTHRSHHSDDAYTTVDRLRSSEDERERKEEEEEEGEEEEEESEKVSRKSDHTFLDHLEEMPAEVRDFIEEYYEKEKFVLKSIYPEVDRDSLANATGNGTTSEEESPNWHKVLNKVVTYIMTFNVIGLMLGMGCAIYWKDIIKNLWPPIGILIGMCGQFLVLPATGFGFSVLFKLKPYEALGCLVVSCSPGGSFSNFFTYWVEGDLALSVVMTACSSIIAFGGMPLNLWLYSSYYVGDESNNIVIPYLSIVRALCFICGPVIVGMVIRHFSQKVAKVITRVTSIVGYLGFLTVLSSWMILYWKLFTEATDMIYAGALILPFTGFTAAYLIAFLFRRSHKVCRTIGIETGSQNMPVALSIILLSFDDPEVRAKMILFPTLYGVFMLCEVFLGIAFYRAVKYCLDRKKKSVAYPVLHTAQIENGLPQEKRALTFMEPVNHS